MCLEIFDNGRLGNLQSAGFGRALGELARESQSQILLNAQISLIKRPSSGETPSSLRSFSAPDKGFVQIDAKLSYSSDLVFPAFGP